MAFLGGALGVLDDASFNSTHSILIKTGDRKNAGLWDGIIPNPFKKYATIVLKSGGFPSPPVELKIKANKGQPDVNLYKAEDNIKTIDTIELTRSADMPDQKWYVEVVVVEYRVLGTRSIFPVHRWLCANETLIITQYDSVLPQDDNYSAQRQNGLEKKRKNYVFKNDPGMPGLHDTLPDDENFSAGYLLQLAPTVLDIFVNTKIRSFATWGDFKKLRDYEKFYGNRLTEPMGMYKWDYDTQFGLQRLSGTVANIIKLCTAIPDYMPVTNDMVAFLLEEETLEAQIAAKKIYMVDLRYLADIKCNEGRKICGPTALFYSNSRGDFIPIAIMLNPVYSASTNPIFLPSDPYYTWMFAKMWFNSADSSHHEAHAHLCMTHFLVESVAMATNRQMSMSHPLFRLLAPHFLYVLAINDAAVNELIAPGGFVDTVMGMGHIGMLNIIKKKWSSWDVMRDGDLRADLANRGVDDVDALPNYYYRDDALLIWDALRTYITTIITNVYKATETESTAQRIAGDTELQAWAAELADVPSGGGVGGMPSKIDSLDQLITLITVFIFTSSAQHAAVNFMQYDEYGYPPNYPAWLTGEPPKTKDALSESDLMESLADKDKTVQTLIIMKILSERATMPLGTFEVQYAYDPVSVEARSVLKSALVAAADRMSDRNLARQPAYTYLDPQEVPNSISI